MGIISFFFNHTSLGNDIAYKAAEVGKDACDKASDAIKNNAQKRIDKFFNQDDGHSRLIIFQKQYSIKESFKVFDPDQNVKYVVKGKLASAKHHLSIYDQSGKNKIGEVKEKLIAFRSPFSFEGRPTDFVIKLHGNKIGKIKSRFFFGKRKFVFKPYNWIIKGDVFGFKYKVLSDKDVVMEVDQKFVLSGDTYFLDVFNPADELLCLMVALAIDCSHTSKSHDTKRALRRVRRKMWL